MLLGCSVARRISLVERTSGKSDVITTEKQRYDLACLNPCRERQDTLVSRREDTVLLGCYGYRRDTDG